MIFNKKNKSPSTGHESGTLLTGGPTAPATDGHTPPPGALIFDVDTTGFEEKVLKASQDIPILVDFWAPWCAPCKQLMPALESAVQAAGGQVLLAKVNIDECPELAQALQVQSVPTVFAFFRGQPVTGFNGVKPASQIQSLIRQLADMARQSRPDALDIDAVLSEAAKALSTGDAGTAFQLYQTILAQDPVNARAFAGLIRAFIAAGQLEQAAQILETAPEEIKTNAVFKEARTALELAQQTPVGNIAALESAVKKDPQDLNARYELAQSLFAQNHKAAAIDQLITIIGIDKEWEEDKARKQLLKYFEAMGSSDPETIAGRRKLSSLLFS